MIPPFEEVMSVTSDVSSVLLLQPVEARGLYDAVAQVPKGGLVVEVGCQLGRSSSLIIQLANAIGFRSIHIDPYTDQPEYLKGWVEMMHRVGGRDHAFTLLCMRTEQAAWQLERLLSDGVSLAYIDGDHTEAGLRVDLELVAGSVHPGGHLVVHDFGPEIMDDKGTVGERFPDVSRVMRQYTAKGWQEIGMYHTLGVWRRK